MKKKITFGILFLLILLIVSGSLGIFNLFKLSRVSNEIIKDNYETLFFCQDMQRVLDSLPNKASVNYFERSLTLQESNITEEGEGEATKKLREDWNKYKHTENKDSLNKVIRSDLNRIEKLNMFAIQRKNDHSQNTADRALLLISIISGFVILITFIFMIKFPSYIANPLQKLIKGIKEITNKNYNHKINIQANDELKELADAFNIMASQLNEFERTNINQLKFQKARAEAVINSLKDASIGIDNEQNILFANAEALQLLNIKSENVIGKKVAEATKYNDLLKFVIDNDQSSPFKIVVNNKDSFFIKEKNSIVKDSQPIGILYTIKNITTFLEKDIAKSNFLATISHELKTPLSSTDIALKLLSNEKIGPLNSDQLQIVNDLKGENQRLIKLVSELLDLSQVETGNIQLNIQQSDPLKILDYAIGAVKALSDKKNIKLEIIKDQSLPLVKADTEKTAWVLINLLTNAIRYSNEASEILIEVKSENDKVIFSVKDFGKGIEAKYKDKIFTRYFQVPESNKTGTGLGLAISKEFIEGQGGEIMLDSEVGKGSKFSFKLSI